MSCTFIVGPGGSGKSHYTQKFEGKSLIYRDRRPSIDEIMDLMNNNEDVIVESISITDEERTFVKSLEDKGKIVCMV